jgi:hypothetical protein
VIDDNFDYTHGKDFWKEKLDYTNSWLSAHISDANAIGKPLIVEEFGKAKSAKKVYTGELINSPKDGQYLEFPLLSVLSRSFCKLIDRSQCPHLSALDLKHAVVCKGSALSNMPLSRNR